MTYNLDDPCDIYAPTTQNRYWEEKARPIGHWISVPRKFKRMLRRNERNGVFCSKCETLFNRKKTGNICPNCEMPIMPRHSRGYRKHIRRMKAKL